MCGIAGILRFKGPPIQQGDLAALKKMGHRLRYRGPDDEQVYVDGEKVAFIFRRLSIMDLAQGGQPFVDSARQTCAMVNGEIYNYQALKAKLNYPFKSHSDCEVILPLFRKKGAALVDDLVGMFAIALWDGKEDKLYLIRDHLGIKPLFYTITEKGHLLFASEIKSLLAHPDCKRELDWNQSLLRCQTNSVSQKERYSGFKDIVYLPAGSMLIVDQKELTLKTVKWWSLDFTRKIEGMTPQTLVEGYRQLLEEAVHSQLMSDVEVGVALSGGIDSLAVAAFASQKMATKTFTLLNLSTYKHGDAEAAFECAEQLRIPNYQLSIPWHTDCVDYAFYKEVIYACEMPLEMEHILKYALYAHIKKSFPSIKTVLIGQGSDEFNGGYCHLWVKRCFNDLPDAQHTWDHFIQAIRNERKQIGVMQKDPQLFGLYPFLDENYLIPLLELNPWEFYQAYHINSIQDYNLWHEDRTMAANQLENRVPFLDHRLVQYCASIPAEFQAPLFWEKRILRDAMAPFLPKKFIEREKVPFYQGPDERYTLRMLYNILRANHDEFLKEALLENPYVKGIIDLTYVENTFQKVSECPSYEGIDRLAHIASLGLLAKWAKEDIEIAKKDTNLSWMIFSSQEREKLDSTVSTREMITPESILTFAPNMRFLFNAQNDFFAVAEGEILLFIVEKKPLIAVLPHIDGHKSVQEILAQTPYTFTHVVTELEECLEYGVLAKAS